MARWLRCFAVVWLVVVAAAASDDAQTIETIETTHAEEVKKTTGFVQPTPGSATQLTLTSYLTDAADLHYAVVAAGYAPPLDAVGIKTAALVVAGGGGDDPSDQNHDGVLVADTIQVDKAQKIQVNVTNLRANTSYDVYFVAEVPGSNGVFGHVIQVLNTQTHPAPPEFDLVQITAVNATFDAAQVRFCVDTLGQAHFAVVSSREVAKLAPDNLLSGDEIIHNGTRNGLLSSASFWHLHDVESVEKSGTPLDFTFTELLPSTHYDVFVVTESFGTSHVLGPVRHFPKSFRTHAMAPDIGSISCVASNGIATQLTIAMELLEPSYTELPADLAFEDAFQVQFKVIQRPDTVASPQQQQPQAFEGVLALRNGKTLLDEAHQHQSLLRTDETTNSFEGHLVNLNSGSLYDLSFVVETIGSHGVLGKERQIRGCGTHFEAPPITKALAQAVNGTTDAIDLHVMMPRQAALHYFYSPKSSSHLLRNVLRSPPDQILNDFLQQTDSDHEVVYGVQIHPIATDPSDTPESGAFSTKLRVTGLRDASQYSFLVFPETLGSNGVFGRAYNELVDASTNQNASEVVLYKARASFGSTNAISVTAGMTKTQDRLHCCVKCVYAAGHADSGDSAGPPTAQNCSKHQEPVCHQLDHHKLSITNAHDTSSKWHNVSFEIGNLSENALLVVHLFTESHEPTEVVSNPTRRMVVRTHSAAPLVMHNEWHPVDATTDQVAMKTELSEPGWLHYAAVVASETESTADSDHVISVKEVVDEKASEQVHSPGAKRPVVQTRGHFQVINSSMEFTLDSLEPNTTYQVHLVSESSLDGQPSGVYGELRTVVVKTHERAPKILKATAVPMNATTMAVFCTINVTSPARIWYKLSDAEYSDPVLLKTPLDKHALPHIVRGFVDVSEYDVSTEIDNNTNQSVPMQPLQYSRNFTIRNLHEATTYHLSLTSETFDSNGVYGEFPPPVLVTTHLPAPHFVPESLVIQAKPGTSTAIEMSFRLSSYGEVHYLLFYRGLLVDSPMLLSGNQTELELFPTPSNFTIQDLTPMHIKEAKVEHLGDGVLTNGTISVKREDVFKGDLTSKEFKDLVPHGQYELCLAVETEASNGVFDWQNADTACHQVRTHADYSNQSILMDDVTVGPMDGTTDAIEVELFMSKRRDRDASATITSGEPTTAKNLTGTDLMEYVAQQTGRVPWFLLVQGKDGRRDFFQNTFDGSYKRELSAIKHAKIGKGNVVANGQMTSGWLHHENDTFVVLRQRIGALQPDTRYFLYVAYETWQSDGVFTVVNPFRHRSNDSNTKNDAMEVFTFEHAPRLLWYQAQPTYGNTSRVTVKFEVECHSCQQALVHLLAFPVHCANDNEQENTHKQLLTIDFLRREELVWSEDRDVQDECRIPLARQSVQFDMLDNYERRQDKKTVEQDLSKNLAPNTTYLVLLATETSGSRGVLSDRFEKVVVTTHESAPSFEQLRLGPRKGSTTELLLEIQLDQPGEVHYMCGEAGHEDRFNVTSPYNISGKKLPGLNSANFHDYPHEAVRLRRSAKIEVPHLVHVEVLDYLYAGKAYDCYVVAETLADQAIYGQVQEFKGVSTFANAPILLAHAAWATAASMTSLSLGYRINTEGNLHVLVVQNEYWPQLERVAFESDKYGNRLAMDQRVVHQKSISIETKDMEHTTDSGWKEMELSVPVSDGNYTIYLVTETAESEGVYGTVASHENLRTHGPPPDIREVFATAADARVDALNVTVHLSKVGHVYYFPWKHGVRFDAQAKATVQPQVITMENSTEPEQSLVMEGLTEGTAYDVFLQTESLNSHGVLGPLRRFTLAARTHGLPPKVLDQLQCAATSACEPSESEANNEETANIRIHGIRIASTSLDSTSSASVQAQWDANSCSFDPDARDQATCLVQDETRQADEEIKVESALVKEEQVKEEQVKEEQVKEEQVKEEREEELEVRDYDDQLQEQDESILSVNGYISDADDAAEVQTLEELNDASLPHVTPLEVDQVLEASQVEVVTM